LPTFTIHPPEDALQTYSTPSENGPASPSGDSATDQAKQKAQEAAGQAKGAMRSQVDQRSTEAGQRVGGFASDVRSVGDQLREQGKDQPAKLADQAADRAERLSGYLKENDADRILGDIEDFGRRQPWAVIAGGVALGLVASRFLKASSSRRYEQRSGTRLPARIEDVSPTASGIHPPPVGAGYEGSY
jgi:gas vesicle protein